GELSARAVAHHARRVRGAPDSVQRVGGGRALGGDGARDDRRDALLEAGVPREELALAGVAAPLVPRVRARERRARERGEALWPRAAPLGSVPKARRRFLRRGSQAR